VVPVTTAWRVLIFADEKRPTDKEGCIRYTEYVVAEGLHPAWGLDEVRTAPYHE